MSGDGHLGRLGLAYPIIQGPMAGGFTPPELVAAVSNAGGLGSLGAAYLTPQQIADAAARIRSLTNKPFCINLFAGGIETGRAVDPAPMLAIMGEIHAALGLPPPVPPTPQPDPFAAQCEAAIRARPAFLSVTFGLPGRDVIAVARHHGILFAATATTVEEGRLIAAAGADVIIAQGGEAGGHRGTFTVPFEQAMVPTLDLVRGIAAVVDTPILAAGGLMDGKDAAAALGAGATGAVFGTAFLVTPEAGAAEAHKRAIRDARRDTTEITRAFSGRPARGLRNAFIERLDGRENAILPYPLQNALTRPMRTAAAKAGEGGYLSLWAGQGVTRSRTMPAGDLVRLLAQEMSLT